jgi:nitroreductase
MTLNLSFEEILTTTRAVRKRLDVTKPVPRAIIEQCLELALQAPNGSNKNQWRWIIVDDPATIVKLADAYKGAMGDFAKLYAPTAKATGVRTPREDELLASALALTDILPKVPAMLIPLLPGRVEGKNPTQQAGLWGSIIQAVWSFCLALRQQGIGTAWTTAGLLREKEIADVLGIPFESYTQVCLLPIAYTVGTDFKKAWRKPVSEVLAYNQFWQGDARAQAVRDAGLHAASRE